MAVGLIAACERLYCEPSGSNNSCCWGECWGWCANCRMFGLALKRVVHKTVMPCCRLWLLCLDGCGPRNVLYDSESMTA